jgi:hypothetical protein
VEKQLEVINLTLSSHAVTKVRETQDRISNEIQKGSGEWLKSEKLYISWLNGEISTLWILGGPG